MDFVTVAQNFGIPAAMLAAVLVANWRIANRVIDNIGIPIRDRILKYFDDKERTDKQVVTTLQSIAEHQQEHILICRSDRHSAAHA